MVIMAKVLVVDDVRDTTDSLVRTLERAGHDAIPTYSQKEAFEHLNKDAFDVVVTDMWMESHKSGLEILKRAKQLDTSVGVIILTAYGKVETAVPAMKLGAFDYVEKTTENYGEKDVYDVIVELVDRCVESRQAVATHQVVLKLGIQTAYPREIELYREQKAEYELFVDDEYGRVYVNGDEVEIDNLPYQILVYLMENRGVLRSSMILYSDIWDDPDCWAIDERTLQDRVKARVSNLRRTLNLPTIQIEYRTRRYGLFAPDGIEYCLIKESPTDRSENRKHRS
jgi:DNA-binding response OmpR family regulator